MNAIEEINQLIEQIKQNLSSYQSQLSSIEIESDREKKRLLAAIKAEEEEIQSLLIQYREIKQKSEIDVIRYSFSSLNNFKQSLIEKIKEEGSAAPAAQTATTLEEKINEVEDLSTSADEDSVEELEAALESENSSDLQANIDTEITENVSQLEDVSQLIQSIDSIELERLVKLYPHNLAQIAPGFDIRNSKVKNTLLRHYQTKDGNFYNALVKLYQKPDREYTDTVPNTKDLSQKDRQIHDFISNNYPNALPLFWHLVNREPDSIRYVVMECAKDHIVSTNEIDITDNPNLLQINFKELLEMNNGSSLEAYFRDLFVCFHPKKPSSSSNSRNKYFDYIDYIINGQATLEHSKILKFWTQMKQFGYQTVAADDFPINDGN